MKSAVCKFSAWFVVAVLGLETGGASSVRAQETTSVTPALGSPIEVVSCSEPYCWTGFYAGGHIGGGWSRGNTSFTPLPTAARFINLAPTTLSPEGSGFLGGLHVGVNRQRGILVTGLELDWTWTGMSESQTVSPIIQNDGTPFPGAGFLTTHQSVDWFGTVRPRVGLAFDRVLLYGTGGLAYGNVNYSANSNFLPPGTIQYPIAFSRTRAGWTVGGGVEIALSDRWSWKAEYLYIDLGSESATAEPSPANPPFQVRYNWETKAHTFNTGLRFRF